MNKIKLVNDFVSKKPRKKKQNTSVLKSTEVPIVVGNKIIGIPPNAARQVLAVAKELFLNKPFKVTYVEHFEDKAVTTLNMKKSPSCKFVLTNITGEPYHGAVWGTPGALVFKRLE